MLPQPPSRTERYARSPLESNLHELEILAIPSEFLPIHRLGTPPRDEWMAVRFTRMSKDGRLK